MNPITKPTNFGIWLLNAIVQIAVHMILYDTINFLARKYYSDYHRSIQWGISVKYYALWFIILVVIAKIPLAIFQNRKTPFLFDLVAMGVFLMVILKTFNSHPLKTSLVFMSALIGVLLPYTWTLRSK